MFSSNASNWRAVVCLVVPFACVAGLVVPAQGAVFLTDETTGVTGQQFGASISELEDQNGDGRGEFLLGAPGDNVNGLDAGAVFYYRSQPGNSHGLWQVWRGAGGEKFGFAVARVGDINSDGTPDFAVGAPLSNAGGSASGRVYLFWGGSSISSSPDMIISGNAAGDQFGFSISAAGDFNGDGEDDFIVGAPYRNAPGSESGAAFVIYGGNGGPSTDLDDALMLGGEIAGDHFGWSVTDAGNFLGTANDCVAVGAPYNTADGIDAGAAYVFEGSTQPTDPDAVFDLKIRSGSSAKPHSKYGTSVRGIGRWDNDGYDDLAIGAPYCNESASEAGRVEIVFGGTSPAATGDRYVNGETATDYLGFALARVGDVLGSGNDDLLIGAPGYDGDATDGGRAYLYAGGSSSTGDAGNLTVLPVDPMNAGTEADDQYGYAVASAGLFDDDGTPDYAVAAPVGNIGTGAAAGYCWIADSGGAVVTAFLPSWEAVWTTDGAVALRFVVDSSAGITGLEARRQVFDAAGTLLTEDTIWSGAVDLTGPADLGGGLTFSGGTFTLVDGGGAAVSGPDRQLVYSLAISLASGRQVTLNELAGPDPRERTVLQPVLQMEPAWPNPFNPSVSVRFRAPAGSAVQCQVTDLRGRRVATLFAGTGQDQWHTVTWDGRTGSGARAASGVYFIRLTAGPDSAVQRVVLAK